MVVKRSEKLVGDFQYRLDSVVFTQTHVPFPGLTSDMITHRRQVNVLGDSENINAVVNAQKSITIGKYGLIVIDPLSVSIKNTLDGIYELLEQILAAAESTAAP